MKTGHFIILLAVLIGVFVIYFVLRNRNKKATTGFYAALVKWIEGEEGGQGHSSLDAAVGGYAPGTDVSVNKGVTWGTYKNLGSVLHYTPTVPEFLAMPFTRWQQIFLHELNKGSGFSPNPILSAYMGLWYWGGWNPQYISQDQVRTALTGSAQQQLRKIVDLRKKYFAIWGQHHPGKEDQVASWQHRADKFYSLAINYI